MAGLGAMGSRIAARLRSVGWSGWQSLGGSVSGDPVAAMYANGGVSEFHVVARGTSVNVVHAWWNGQGWHYEDLGGNV